MDLYALRHSVIHCLKFKVYLSLCTSIVIRLHEQKAGIKDIQKLSAERFGETRNMGGCEKKFLSVLLFQPSNRAIKRPLNRIKTNTATY